MSFYVASSIAYVNAEPHCTEHDTTAEVVTEENWFFRAAGASRFRATSHR